MFSKYYIGFAVLSAIFFGSFNFILDSVVKEQMSLRVMYLVGVGSLTYYIAFHLVAAFRLYRSKSTLWTKTDSAYFKENGTLDLFLIRIILGRSVFSVLLFTLLYIIMYTA